MAGDAPPDRLFVAAELPEAVRRALAERARDLAARTGGRAVPEDRLHVTLHFLGRVAPERLPALRAAVAEAGGGHEVTVALGALRARPHAACARLVAVELADPEGGLGRLHERLAPAVAEALGGAAAERLWPHVTLVRLPEPRRVALSELPLTERTFGISRAGLYDSQHEPGGPRRYVPLVVVGLGSPT